MDLADRIRICRENANLTQKELAAQLQLPADIILQWEQGLLQPPVQILPQLLACLHVSLEELVPQEPAYAPQTAYSAPPTPKRKALSLRAIRIWKAVGLILFIANFFTIFAALSTVGGMSARNHLFVENMWAFFLFTPIPLASIVVGILLLRRRLAGVKNIVAGGIFLFLLCAYGSFTPIFGALDVGLNQTPEEQGVANTQRLQQVETFLGTDLPEPEQMQADTFTAYYPGQGDLQCTNVTFDAAAMGEFEQQLKADDRWFTTVPTVLKGFFPESYTFTASASYKLLYNADLDQFNTVPEQGGQYHYFLVCYSPGGYMQIYEYDLRYITQ